MRISDQQRFRIGVPFLFQSCKQSVLSLCTFRVEGLLAKLIQMLGDVNLLLILPCLSMRNNAPVEHCVAEAFVVQEIRVISYTIKTAAPVSRHGCAVIFICFL